MIIYELKLNNFYRFQDFEMDLTIPRSSVKSPIIQQHSRYPNIKYKKFALLLGANASGKTALGRSLCLIQNFLSGKQINISWIQDLINDLEERKLELEWEIYFSNDDILYFNKTKLKSTGIEYEEWRHIELKNLYYPTLKNKLFETESHYVKTEFNPGIFQSHFINDKESPINKLVFGWQYTFSGDQTTVDLSEIKPSHLKQIMHSFDSSIIDVYKSDDIEGNMIVNFKDNHKEIILKNGKLANGTRSILSTGTKESIVLSYILAIMASKKRGTFYVDEKMSHVHSEIEQQIIQIMITLVDKIDGQVFITSHNSDLLDMKLPNYNFMLFKKNSDGTINELIQPEKLVKHNDRSLKSIVEQDVFSTAPHLDDLIELHESIFEDTYE